MRSLRAWARHGWGRRVQQSCEHGGVGGTKGLKINLLVRDRVVENEPAVGGGRQLEGHPTARIGQAPLARKGSKNTAYEALLALQRFEHGTAGGIGDTDRSIGQVGKDEGTLSKCLRMRNRRAMAGQAGKRGRRQRKDHDRRNDPQRTADLMAVG
jgi:hypothetical protein